MDIERFRQQLRATESRIAPMLTENTADEGLGTGVLSDLQTSLESWASPKRRSLAAFGISFGRTLDRTQETVHQLQNALDSRSVYRSRFWA